MTKYILLGEQDEDGYTPKAEVDQSLDTSDRLAQLEASISFAIVDVQVVIEDGD